MKALFEAQRLATAANKADKSDTSPPKAETSDVDSSPSNQMLLKKFSEPNTAVKFVIDFSAVNYIDTNGVKMLADVIENLMKADVFACICSPQSKHLF